MVIVFYCPACGRQLSAEPQYAGMQVQCPGCSAMTTVPAQAAGPAPPAAPPPLPTVASIQPPAYWPAAPLPRPRTSGLARAALVLCIIPVTAPLGIILAIVALVKLGGRTQRKGAGLAVAGLCVGVGLWGVGGLYFAMVVAPRLARERLIEVRTRGRIGALANACEAYCTHFDAYPTILDDPPETGGSPARLSGSQNLRLALLGCARDGDTYSQRSKGPAEHIDSYEISRRFEPFHTHRHGELVPHNEVWWRDRSQDDAYGTIEVFVDYLYQSPRPILYFRARPRYIDPGLYRFADNAVYCDPDKGETEEQFRTWLQERTSGRQAAAGFLLISAGPDRIYFTDDDITNILP